MIGWIHTQTHRLMRGIFEYAIKMGSSAMIHIPSFIKISSGIQVKRGDSQTHIQHGDFISILSFFQAKESRQKINSRSSISMGRNQKIGIYC
jgi:hypothetical protein